MSVPPDVETPEHWEEQYQRGNTRWDIGQPAPPFVDLLVGSDAPPPGGMIVLGCGRGHDALLFARAGFDVLGVDFAATPVAEARTAAQRAGLPARFEQRDIFALPAAWDHSFDYVLEHTCVSALPPTRRPAYVEVVRRLLVPGGHYIALFFTHGQPGGPPFDIRPADIRQLFAPSFHMDALGPPVHSIAARQGQETFALMRLRAETE